MIYGSLVGATLKHLNRTRAVESRIVRSFKAGLSIRRVARMFRIKERLVEQIIREWM